MSNSSDASLDELNELRRKIIKHDLIIDAVKNVICKGVLKPTQEEYLALTLYPTNNHFADSTNSNISFSDLNSSKFVLKTMHIPTLKGLTEKDIVETYLFIQGLVNASGGLSISENDSKTDDTLLSTVQNLTDEVSGLRKRVDALAQLHSKGIFKPLRESADSLVVRAEDVQQSSKELETVILQQIFGNERFDVYEEWETNMEEELIRLTDECDAMKKDLAKYEQNKDALLAAATEYASVCRDIQMKRYALDALSL